MTAAREIADRFLSLQRIMYAGGRIEDVEMLLAEDVLWHVPGRSAIAGEYYGREAVLDYFRTRRELAGGAIVITKLDHMHDEDVFVQLADGAATVDGSEVRWRTVGVYRVADGKIAEAWLVPLDARAFDDVWRRLADRDDP